MRNNNNIIITKVSKNKYHIFSFRNNFITLYQPPILGTLVLECNDKLYRLLFATGKGSWSKFEVLFLRFFTRSNTILAHNGVYVLSWTPIFLEVLHYKKNPHYTLVALYSDNCLLLSLSVVVESLFTFFPISEVSYKLIRFLLNT